MYKARHGTSFLKSKLDLTVALLGVWLTILMMSL